jgi:hypothetical protein
MAPVQGQPPGIIPASATVYTGPGFSPDAPFQAQLAKQPGVSTYMGGGFAPNPSVQAPALIQAPGTTNTGGWYAANQNLTLVPTPGPGVINTGLPLLQTPGNSASPTPAGSNGNGKGEEAEKPPEKKPFGIYTDLKLEDDKSTFMRRFYSAYYNQFFPPKDPPPEEPPLPRTAPPSPWPSPPFPGNEYQGYPLLGINPEVGTFPFMQAVYGGPFGQQIKDSRITFEGWVTAEGNISNAKNSNVPTSYWVRPNAVDLDQLVFKFERIPDTVQQDHWDWGFRAIMMYGEDYRYTTAGGWGSAQLLEHNNYYGWDPTELYANVFIPGLWGGTDIRVGRWIACPDIETQYSVNNYMGSHSILFTYDTYTNTGIMVSQKLNSQWEVQAALTAGTDMAPWYPGAIPTFGAGVRWVSKDNNDSIYTWLNQCNDAQFRHFEQYGQPLGHDNFNYIVSTWTHRFSEEVHTSTEAYYMWQYNAELGGTPSAGPTEPYGGGGGNGTLLPGLSRAYGVLNYTMVGITNRDYITFRNEWYRDERGMRTGYPGNYTSNSVGLSHQFNDLMMIRPEIGFYRNWTQDAFDNGTKRNLLLAGFDFTVRF